MPSANLSDAAKCPFVVLARFDSSTSPKAGVSNEDLYFQGLRCHFVVEKILKAAAKSELTQGAKFALQYEFQDGSACQMPRDFEWQKSLPVPKSRWILYMEPAGCQSGELYRTYRGDFGARPFSAAALKEAQALVAR
ncbi:MAG: hypothetical protein K2X27_17810 [Candidatus Obscuribacterales bacterium]|nr:hypothetical protein [Candidatus Obscuribacterales bacterium]